MSFVPLPVMPALITRFKYLFGIFLQGTIKAAVTINMMIYKAFQLNTCPSTLHVLNIHSPHANGNTVVPGHAIPLIRKQSPQTMTLKIYKWHIEPKRLCLPHA